MLCMIFYFYPKVYCKEVGFIPSHSIRCWSRCIETAKCKCHKLENRRKLSFFQLFGIFCGQSELEYKTSFLLKLLIYLRLWAERRREAWEGVWRPSWSWSCEFSSGNVFNGKKIQISFSLSHILFLTQTFTYLQSKLLGEGKRCILAKVLKFSQQLWKLWQVLTLSDEIALRHQVYSKEISPWSSHFQNPDAEHL